MKNELLECSKVLPNINLLNISMHDMVNLTMSRTQYYLSEYRAVLSKYFILPEKILLLKKHSIQITAISFAKKVGSIYTWRAVDLFL